MAKRAPPKGKAARSRVSAKVSHLVEEGHPQKQAVAMAMSMEREHRLGPGGGYKRAKRSQRGR